MRHFLFAPFLRWLSRLSHPKLFMVVGVLFLIDLAIPNFVPWDDILLGIGTLILARMKKKDPVTPGSANATPPIESTSTRR